MTRLEKSILTHRVFWLFRSNKKMTGMVSVLAMEEDERIIIIFDRGEKIKKKAPQYLWID